MIGFDSDLMGFYSGSTGFDSDSMGFYWDKKAPNTFDVIVMSWDINGWLVVWNMFFFSHILGIIIKID